MNSLNVNQVGGLPLTTLILAELQKAYAIFNAFGNIVGNLTIISGCQITGSTVSDGVVFINGEVFEFRGGLIQDNVIIIDEPTDLLFNDGNYKPVIHERFVRFGTGSGSFLWSDFKRGLETKNLQDLLVSKASASVVSGMLTDLGTAITKLATIQTGAQVNVPQVKTNWTETNPASPAFLENKPSGSILTFLKKGSFSFDDFGAQTIHTIGFDSVGTGSYMVLGSMVSSSSNWQEDDSVIWTIREKTATSFKLLLREVQGDSQTLTFNYIIIPI